MLLRLGSSPAISCAIVASTDAVLGPKRGAVRKGNDLDGETRENDVGGSMLGIDWRARRVSSCTVKVTGRPARECLAD